MALSIQSVSKCYENGTKALNQLSLEIGKGMFGLLGPNGAGKSSLMRTIATLQTADSGKITFHDIDVFASPMELRKVLGYLPQSFGVYPNVSAEKLLDYFATLKGIASKKSRKLIIAEVLELTNLTEVRKKAVSTYSGGMKQRFGIAQLLLNKPQLLIVDEPTAGLDPAERNRFLNLLREIGHDHTVIFSTHIVEDIKDLCNDMAIMHRGRILKHCQPSEAIETLLGKVWIQKSTPEKLNELKQHHSILGSNYTVHNELMVRIFSEQAPGPSAQPTSPTLEDAYFLSIHTH